MNDLGHLKGGGVRIKLLIAGALVSMNVMASPGYIAKNVKIVSVANTGANAMTFTVRTANGTGICSGESITFPLSIAGNAGNNEGIHNRAYSAALMALASEKKVSIYSYEDSSICSKAAYIEVFK
ncbi:DUF5992 family protein [Microbulbifer sp. JMSA008]|uniref:DUF5992 family protein n=1 Tax=Microbulbifer sp. JMSA008 TaxID=3243373 RepID=UPI00403984B7